MEAFVKAILNASITASYIAVAVAVLRIFMKKAPKFITVLLWGLVALRLVLPVLPESNLSLIPNPNPITSVTQGDDAPPTADTPDITPPVADTDDDIQPSPPVSAIPDNDVVIEQEQQQVTSTPEKTSPWRIAFWVWVAGVGAMLIYAFISWRRVLGTVREAIPTEGRAWVCDGIPSPFILGVFRPRVYMPAHLSKTDTVYVTAHENAHIKRGDHLWKPLGFLLLSLHWFNPVMWVAYILLCRDIELACDEKAINALGAEHKKPYSHALISCSAKSRLISACPLAFGEGGVKGRVKTVLNYKKPAFWIIIVSLIACIAVGVVFLTNPKTEPDDKEQTPYIDEALIGTWYGIDIDNAGARYRFEEDGSGGYGFRWMQCGFDWTITDGVLSYSGPFSQKNPSGHACGGTSVDDLEYEIKDGIMYVGENRYSKEQPDFGGDDRFLNFNGFLEEAEGKTHYFFHEGGSLEIWTYIYKPADTQYYDSRLQDRVDDCIWKTNAENDTLTVITKDGSTSYKYAFKDGKLYLTKDEELVLIPIPDSNNNWNETPSETSDEPGYSTESTEDSFESIDESVESMDDPGELEIIWKQKGTTLTVSGKGDIWEVPFDFKKKTNITHLIISEGITSLPTRSFDGYTSLKSVSLPESLTYIGSYAFSNCTSLTSIKLPSGVDTVNGNIFDGCTALKKIVLPKSLDRFSKYSFNGLTRLEEFAVEDGNEHFFTKDGILFSVNQQPNGAYTHHLVYCPKGKQGACTVDTAVAYIDPNAFQNCQELTSVTFASNVTAKIYKNMFYGCTKLKEVRLGKGTYSIETEAFAGCPALETLVYDGTTAEWAAQEKLIYWRGTNEPTLKRVICTDGTVELEATTKTWSLDEDGTFTLLSNTSFSYLPTWEDDKDNIKTVIIKDGVTVIPKNAFSHCKSLTSVHIPNSVTNIQTNAFAYCTALKEITLPDSLKEIYGTGVFAECYSLEKLTLPKELTIIGANAFYNCISLKTITLPKGLESISRRMFNGCVKLTTVSIPSSVTEIEAEAFAGCSSLKTVTGAVNVKSIGYNAFNGCGITDISFAKSVTSLGDAAFCVCANLKTAVLPVGIDKVPMHLLARSAVETVHVPVGVTAIHSLAFDGGSLKTVVYSGTIEEWSRITLDALWLGDAEDYAVTVKCTDGTITAENTKGPITNDNPGPIHP